MVVELSAKDPDVLGGVAPKVADAIAKVPGIEPASVNDGVVPAGDALEIHVDPGAAASEGMTPDDVRSQVYHYLNGAVVTQYLGEVQDVGVRLWLDPSAREDLPRPAWPDADPLAERPRLPAESRSPGSTSSPASPRSRATISPRSSPSPRRSAAATTSAPPSPRCRTCWQSPGCCPTGVYYTIGGQYKQQQMAMDGMIKVFAAAAVAEFILLLFLYNRFWLPIIIISSAVISSSAVFIGLWLTGVELNITAMMGMVMIVGIGTEMAIFFASEYQELEKTMPPRQALRAAALNRLRPIAMSTLAMILALLPLGAAISGSGDQMLQPLAIAIIAGIIVQLPLVLLRDAGGALAHAAPVRRRR